MDQALIERDAAGRDGGGGDAGRLDLRITGMSCAACVRRVERAAAAVPGVQAVAVNLATERAAVTAVPGLRLSDLAGALAKVGYPVVEETVDLAIAGMSCASCVGRVERALMRLPGVLAAEVNLATERARVRVAAGAAGPGELAAAVEAAGYGAALPASASTMPGHEHDAPGGAPGRAGQAGTGWPRR